MRRIIRKVDLSPPSVNAKSSGPPKADSHMDQVAKLVPAEIVAAFLAVDNLILSKIGEASNTTDSIKMIYWGGVFTVLLIATPFYVKRAITSQLPLLKSQLVVSTLAFVFWAFAIGGPFALTNWYDHMYAGLALIVFSVVSPLMIPKK